MTNKKKIFIICVILILFFTTIFLKEYKTVIGQAKYTFFATKCTLFQLLSFACNRLMVFQAIAVA